MPDSDRQFETWFKPSHGEGPISTVQTNVEGESPTAQAYADFDFIQHFFIDRAFNGDLPKSVITFNRRPRSTAYLAGETFQSIAGRTAHELSFNLVQLRSRGDAFAMSVVLCALVGVWRQTVAVRDKLGPPPTRGYCDRLTADKMQSVGLIPTNSGQPGGKRTGYRVSYAIADGGLFDLDSRELVGSGFRIRWHDRPTCSAEIEQLDEAVPATSKNTRTRFVCLACDLKAWSRASARLACVACNRLLIATESSS